MHPHSPLTLLLLLVAATGDAAAPKKLPSYIQLCSLKDPHLEECALRHGRAALPFFVKGEASLRLPQLDPLALPEVRVQQGSGPSALDLHSRNIIIKGLADTQLDSIRIDMKNNFYDSNYNIRRLELLGDYQVNGKILVLPVRGSGKSNFTFENVSMNYFQPYTLESRNGYRYIHTSPSKVTFNCTQAYFNLENLFNGDPKLGESVNSYLNENWRIVVDELSEPFMDATARVIRSFFDSVVSNVPYENIFLDAAE